MSDITVIHSARLLRTQHKSSERYKIIIAEGNVCSVEPMRAGEAIPESGTFVDAKGDWITLGAVDLQINGALGLAFPDMRISDLEKLEQICDLLWEQGVDSFCPTLVTTSLDNFHGALSAIEQFQQQQKGTLRTAKVIGAHLEGPFLNVSKRGAHPEKFLQSLSLENVKRLVGDFAKTVSIMTLAPECAADERVVEWLVNEGITVSLGHSLATEKQSNRAFEQGATMITHAFNAMPGLHHREPSILGAALTNARISIGFIADGQHICPTMLDLLLRAGRGGLEKNLGGLFLVSDALSPLGLPDGTYPWDEREIEVVNGTARLADGTLSGTTLPLIKGAQNLVAWGLCEVEEAIALATAAPRSALTAAVSNHALSSGCTLLEVSKLEGSNHPTPLIRWHQDTEGQLSWHRL